MSLKQIKKNIKRNQMRKLIFTETNLENYSVIYEGLSMTRFQFSNKQSRRLDNIFERLEQIGVKSGEKIGSTEFYKLVEPAVVALEDADFDIIKEALEPPNVPWNGAGARKAGRVLNWLDTIQVET